jgi:predicted SAM-dependent methyltransferase
MLSRQDKILACIKPSNQSGIEIGAQANPIVTPDVGMIRYVDHETTEGLKAKYAQNPGVDISKIVNVDYVWGLQTLPELVAHEVPFDYVIASHVIEHVPNFIGWLKEVHSVLKLGGILSLAIPDKRQCFDYLRQPTRLAEFIEAYLFNSKKPSPKQIFDYYASVVSKHGKIVWLGEVETGELAAIYSEEEAWNITSSTFAEGKYCDVHCWVFTPYSFFELLRSLIKLKLFDFKVEKFFDTDGCEFYVSLESLDTTPPNSQRDQLESLPAISLQD